MDGLILRGGYLNTLALLRQMQIEGNQQVPMAFIAATEGFCVRSARTYVKSLQGLGLIRLSRSSAGLSYTISLTESGISVLERSKIGGTSKFRKLDSCPF
jgi:hypothetical protein